MMLSLQIPQNEVHLESFYWIPYDQNNQAVRSQYLLKKKESVYTLRKQIAEQFGVHPWSFVLGIVDDDEIDLLICRNKTIGDFSDEKGKLFAYQIPPELFEQADQKVLETLTEQCESGAVNMTVDDDENNGLPRNWVKVPIRFQRLQKAKYSYYERKTDVSYQRLFWINTEWTVNKLHAALFSYVEVYFRHESSEETAALNTDEL